MRVVISSALLALLIVLYGASASAETNLFALNLSLGSTGSSVRALQKILNQDPDTRIAASGLGSPGNETSYFGLRTKMAVMRFQEKYAGDVLAPAGLSQGNGRVGFYTRAKLNSLSSSVATTAQTNPPAATTIAPDMAADYLVKDGEKIDIYAGDKMIAKVQDRISAAINAAIAAQSTATATMPIITTADVPNVAIKELAPRSGPVGTRISISGNEISSESVLYIGTAYIVRTLNKDIFGNFSFIIPPIPPARYDVAIKTGNVISGTAPFVITDPKNPSVHIQSVSPSVVAYGGTLTIKGSGFSRQNNIVITTYQRFDAVPSPDGQTLTLPFAPESLRRLAGVGRGTDTVSVSVSVVNENGFSDSEKSFTMTI